MTLPTKYSNGSHVRCVFKSSHSTTGKIVGIRLYQSCHYRDGFYMIRYHVTPAEFDGMEHDNGEWIFEGETKEIPRILGLV